MLPPQAQREIKILHVDDEPEFLTLTRIFLERERENFVVDTAISAEEALARLNDTAYNVIVSDYQMPGLDGLTFLQQVRERNSTIPFIMFTGKGREEVAIEALNRGANHYLQKGTDIVSMYGTLINAIEEVVSKNWALEALKTSESEYRTIFETTGTATVIIAEDATLALINTEFEHLSGCSRAEVEGKRKWTEFVVHEDLARMREYHRLRRKDPNAAPSTYEFRFVDAAGTIKDILLSINMIAGTKKSVASLLDITQRKKAELALREAEAKYAAVVENSLDGIVILQDGVLKFVNRSYSALMGYTSDELLGKNFLEMVAPEFRELTLKRYTDRLSGKEPPNIYEIALLSKDGSILPVEINATVMSYDGKPADLVFIRDITDRKGSEEALRASEAKYRTMIEHTGTGICVVEEDTTISFVNQEFERITGYTKAEVEGNVSWTDLIVEEDLAVMKQRHKLRRAAGSKVPSVYEFRLKTKSGETKHILLNVDLIPGTRKSIASLIDITDRKRMEERLREDSSFRTKVIAKAAEGLCVCHELPEYPFVAFTVWNDRMTEITGYTMAEINQLGWYQSMYPDPELRARAVERMARMRKGDDLAAEEWVITRADGEKRTLLISTSVLKTEDRHTHVLALMQDVTERKQIETGLKENERFLRDIFDGIQDGISVLDCDLNVRRVNWWVEQKYADEWPLIGKKCFAVYQKRQTPCPWCPSLPTIETGIAHTAVVPYPVADNPTGWIELSAYPLKDPDGCVTGIVEYVKDITARKQAEEALRESEEKFRNLAEESPNMIFINKRGRVVYANKRCEEVMGYRREEFYALEFDFLSIHAPESVDRLKVGFQRYMNDEEDAPYEITLITKDGKRVEAILSPKIIQYEGEKALLGIVTDITALKQTEATLKASEARYRTLFERSPAAITLVDKSGVIIDCNKATEALTGYAKAELHGEPFENLATLDPKDLPHLKQICERLLHGEEVAPYELELMRKDGNKRWIAVVNSPLVEDDALVRFLIIATDITDRKRAEEALRESRARYKDLADSLPQVVFEADERGNLTFVNRNAFDVFGYTEDELARGLNALQMVVPADRDRAARNIQQVLRGESEGGIEYTALRKDGSTFPVSIHTSRILRERKPVGLRGFLIDETARKQAEDTLRKSEELYRLLTEESPFGVAIISSDGRYRRVNATFVELFGYSLEDIPTGRAWFSRAFPDKAAREAARSAWLEDLKAAQPGEFRPRTFTVTCKDGSQKVICFRSVTLSTGEQLVTYEDITDQKRAEEERAKILNELSVKNRELERFTYTISHDLRSPLVTIEGFADMLQKDLAQNNHARAASDLQYITTAATRMDELLSVTLKLSRIGRMANPSEDVPFGKLVQDALAQTAGEIQASGVEVAVADQFPSVHVDRIRIAELLVNLISNSIKYRGDRPDPRIEIGQRMDGEETVFFVKDNGIGIDKSEQEKVFEIFYQVDTRSEGTGAGLAIVRRIVELHGGRIWIESEVDKGCTVCFTLPVASIAL